MVDFVRVPETDWQNILDAVRGKTGGTEKMRSGVVAQAIAGNEAGSGGSFVFEEKGTITHASSGYWKNADEFDPLYTPLHDCGILLLDWGDSAHKGAESDNGIQTQMFVYTPTEYRYVGWGYRKGNGTSMDSCLNGVRTTPATSLRVDDQVRGNGSVFVGYINSESTTCTAFEAELTKETNDMFMAIMSGCFGYVVS